MSAPTLRPYQTDLIDRLRASLRVHRRSILQSPTGSGKTVLIAHMIGRAAEAGRTAWLTCHRVELVDQLSRALWKAGVPHGVIAAGRAETKELVQVASIQSLVRRLYKLPAPALLAIDEAHHSAARTWRTVLEHCRDSWVVGLTATPARTDGQGLSDLFNDIVLGPSVAELTDAGFLAPYRIFAPTGQVDLSGVHTRGGDWVREELEEVVDQSNVVGDAVAHYQRLVAPGNCLVYCVSRAHARHVEAAYQAAGIDARYCAGDTPKAEREAIVKGLARCQPAVVVSVELFGEGLDCPGLRAVQLLRPTQSLVLHLQMIGRALRPEVGKSHALILDHVRNSLRLGLPDDPREWTLEGRKHRKSSGDETAPALRHCPECFCVFRATLPACPGVTPAGVLCGWIPETKARVPEHVDGELVELDRAQIEKERMWRKQEERTAASIDGFEGLVRLAVEREYATGWAAHRWAARLQRQGQYVSPNELFRQERELRKAVRA